MDNPRLTEWLTQPGGVVAEMARLQDEAGLTGTEMARRMGVNQATVSRWRRGLVKIDPKTVIAWCDAVGRPDEAKTILQILAEGSIPHLPWHQRLTRPYADIQEATNALTMKCRRVTMVEVETVPGPAQTPSYARAVFEAVMGFRGHLDADLDDAVTGRMTRARWLADGEGPDYLFVFGEQVLRRMPCGVAEMVEQLDYLVSLALGNPKVDLRVIPDGPNRGAMLVCSHHTYHLESGEDLVLVETVAAETEYTGDDVGPWRDATDWVLSVAVSGDEAVRLIREITSQVA